MIEQGVKVRVENHYKIRLDTFNLVKGILMIIIVLYHKVPHYNIVIGENIITKIISAAFDCVKTGVNPAFFVISGFSFRVMSTKKCFEKTVTEILKSCLLVMVAYTIFFPIFHYAAFRWWAGALQETIRFVMAFLFGLPSSGKIIFGIEAYECSVVWFLYALFVAQNILNAILNVKKEKMRPVLVLLCIVLGYILLRYKINYYCIPQGLIGVGYCYAGYLVKRTKVYNKKYFPVLCIILAILGGIQGRWSGFNMPAGVFGLGIIDCFLAGCAGVLWLFIGIIIGNLEGKVCESIRVVGMYTYWILCVHSVEMSCIPWYLWRTYTKGYQFLGCCVEVLIACVIFVLACTLLKKISKYRYRRRYLING